MPGSAKTKIEECLDYEKQLLEVKNENQVLKVALSRLRTFFTIKDQTMKALTEKKGIDRFIFRKTS
jgi:hypothetical protein